VTFTTTGSATAGFSTTASIAAGAGSGTGVISDNIMTLTAVASGTFRRGGTISGTSVTSGTTIIEQLSGTANGVGTYLVTPGDQTVTSTTISETHGIMTVTVVGSGTLKVGDLITPGGGGGSNTVAGTWISELGTGAGGTGTYIVSNNTVVTSGTIAAVANYETKWFAQSYGAAGELVKMSSWATG